MLKLQEHRSCHAVTCPRDLALVALLRCDAQPVGVTSRLVGQPGRKLAAEGIAVRDASFL
jgi:hypothetical protein